MDGRPADHALGKRLSQRLDRKISGERAKRRRDRERHLRPPGRWLRPVRIVRTTPARVAPSAKAAGRRQSTAVGHQPGCDGDPNPSIRWRMIEILLIVLVRYSSRRRRCSCRRGRVRTRQHHGVEDRRQSGQRPGRLRRSRSCWSGSWNLVDSERRRRGSAKPTNAATCARSGRGRPGRSAMAYLHSRVPPEVAKGSAVQLSEPRTVAEHETTRTRQPIAACVQGGSRCATPSDGEAEVVGDVRRTSNSTGRCRRPDAMSSKSRPPRSSAVLISARRCRWARSNSCGAVSVQKPAGRPRYRGGEAPRAKLRRRRAPRFRSSPPRKSGGTPRFRAEDITWDVKMC